VTSDQWAIVRFFLAAEIQMANAYAEALDELGGFMSDVETFDGPNIRRYRELVLTLAAFRAFAPGLEWMRDPGAWAS